MPLHSGPLGCALNYAFGCALNLTGRVLFNSIESSTEITRPSRIETAIFLNAMADISPKFKKPDNRSTYIEKNLYECEYVWLKKLTKRRWIIYTSDRIR